jgi:iron complex transport system ATP-binding protein
MGSAFLHIDSFSCGYEQFRLDNITFSLSQGSFTGIIGPNGSGKTTLFKGITQGLPALTGRITLSGQDLRHMSARIRARQIAIVSQFEPMGQISLMDYVLMGRIPYYRRWQFFESDHDRKIAEHYMELTGIREYQFSRMSELSGGEQQRAALARALTQEPRLLLLDEPTAHLDITHQVRILDLLQKLNEELKLTVLMVIHDLNLASEYCDRLILMQEGRVYTQGSPAEVIHFETIEKVYQTPVITRINPYSGKPVVFLISKKMLDRRENGAEGIKD